MDANSPGRVDHSPAPLLLLAAAVAVPVMGWMTILNWHADDEPWRGWLLTIAIGAVAVAGGWLKRTAGTAAVLAIALTVMFVIDSSTEEPTADASLWPVGAVFIFFGALLGSIGIGLLGRLARFLTNRGVGNGD